MCVGATNTFALVEASYQLAILQRQVSSTRSPDMSIIAATRRSRYEQAENSQMGAAPRLPFFVEQHIGRSTSARAPCPYKKVALSSNSVRLRHAEEQSMRTSRPPGMGRRCAPRRQYRPPSGDQHPGDGAMAPRPSRRSTTCPWRLSGSSGPRPRIWALGGLVRPVEKYKSLENALMPGRTVTHGGARAPESAGRP